MSPSRSMSVAVPAFLVLLGLPSDSEGCSVFALQTENGPVYGQNLEWREWFPGHVCVNVRGVTKSVLDWKGHWPSGSERPAIAWTSRYGSVTFTCYGRDFIEGGMNEAGLMVDETNLTAVYPPDDGRPGVSCAQWMQYQLDNFQSVEEVIDHLHDLRPDGEGWHYLIADAHGRCAVIEYRAGAAVVYTGDDLKVWALSNTTYEQGLSHIPMDSAFGGNIDISSGSDAYGKFVRMAILLKAYDPVRHPVPRDYAFSILDVVGSEYTLRSVVYDAPARRVLWKTQSNSAIRWLDLSALNFSPSAPTMVLDVERGGAGDMSAWLVEYSVDANRQLVRAVLDSGARSDATVRLLAERGLTHDKVVEALARHPTSAVERRVAE